MCSEWHLPLNGPIQQLVVISGRFDCQTQEAEEYNE
jgi:hypothetical protein